MMGTITRNEDLLASGFSHPANNRFIDLTDDEEPIVSSTTSHLSTQLSSNTTESSSTHCNHSEGNSESLDDSLSVVYEYVVPPPDIQFVKSVDHNPLIDCEKCSKKHSFFGNVCVHVTLGTTSTNTSLQADSDHETSDIQIMNSVDSPRKEPQISPQSLDTLSSSNKQTKKSPRIDCAICMDGTEEIIASGRYLVATICGHIFCSLCIEKAFENSKLCPKCRKRLNKKQFHPLYV